jgi:hypothetical protein
MSENLEFRKKFLTNTDETGRYIVKSIRTGKTYYVEPIGSPYVQWGSIDPVTKKLVNKKGHDKYRGSIDMEDSMISEENGFTNIQLLPAGTSPASAIEVLDSKYPDKKK